jgi:hypothetical protein
MTNTGSVVFSAISRPAARAKLNFGIGFGKIIMTEP